MSQSYRKEKIPTITVGRYAGTQIDKLPNSYLRWMISQDFPKDWVEAAERKLKQSDYNDIYLSLSRHAIDMFSLRFLEHWQAHLGTPQEKHDGLATFVTKMAQRAWSEGRDVSKHRHQDDGTVKELDGIRFVFIVNPNFPDYKNVITIMGTDQ